MNKYLKIGLILAGIGIITALGIFYWAFNKPHRNIAREEAKFQVQADSLFAAFSKDEAAANAKYNDQVVEVTGALFGINPDEKTFTLILDQEMSGVSCVLDSAFSAENAQRILALEPGKTLSIKGRVVGLDLLQGVMVDNAILINP